MSAAAFSTTVLGAVALINHAIKSLNERRGLQCYCAERRGLNIHLIFLYAALRLSNLLEWALRPSNGNFILFKRSAVAFTLSVMGAAALMRTISLFFILSSFNFNQIQSI